MKSYVSPEIKKIDVSVTDVVATSELETPGITFPWPTNQISNP